MSDSKLIHIKLKSKLVLQAELQSYSLHCRTLGQLQNWWGDWRQEYTEIETLGEV